MAARSAEPQVSAGCETGHTEPRADPKSERLQISVRKAISSDLRNADKSEGIKDFHSAAKQLRKALEQDRLLSSLVCQSGELGRTDYTEQIVDRLLAIYYQQNEWAKAHWLCEIEGPRIWSANVVREKQIWIVMDHGDYPKAKASLIQLMSRIDHFGGLNNSDDKECYKRLQLMLETCEDRAPKPTEDYLLGQELVSRAQKEVYRNNLQEAEDLFKQALKLNRQSFWLYYSQGSVPSTTTQEQIISGLFGIYLRQERYGELEELLRTHGREAWVGSVVDIRLAQTLMAQQKYSEAWQFLQQFDPPKEPAPGGFCGNPYAHYESMVMLISVCKQGMQSKERVKGINPFNYACL